MRIHCFPKEFYYLAKHKPVTISAATGVFPKSVVDVFKGLFEQSLLLIVPGFLIIFSFLIVIHLLNSLT